MTTIGLVGCVKSKRPYTMQAQYLYTSPLFEGARCYVQRTCDAWFILSAKHGLVPPDKELAPYEQTLTTASVGERAEWAKGVLHQVDLWRGDLRGYEFYMHAGQAYVGYGLAAGLLERGARVFEPLAGLRQGQRLAFYKQAGCLGG